MKDNERILKDNMRQLRTTLDIFIIYDYPQSYHQSFEYHAETQSAQRCFLPTYCFAHAETHHNGARPQRPADSYA